MSGCGFLLLLISSQPHERRAWPPSAGGRAGLRVELLEQVGEAVEHRGLQMPDGDGERDRKRYEQHAVCNRRLPTESALAV